MENYSLISILIVDDDATDLDALNSILKPTYTVYVAKSGQTALNRALTNTPDLILLDIMMPDMSGYEVLTELKKNEETRDIPVIFITGLNSVADEEKGFQLGAVDYITKPFHAEIVKARINAHIQTANMLNSKDNASITLKTRQEIRNIKYRELIYVDVTGHWLNFYLTNGSHFSVYASLKQYEAAVLTDPRFARCHKSFLVNMDLVDIVEVRDVLLKNGVRIPISKRYSDFKKLYLEWVSD